MSTLHTSLQELGPVDFSTVPTEPDALKRYIQEHLGYAALLADSVPPPPPVAASGKGSSNKSGRERSNTTDNVPAGDGSASRDRTPTGLSASTGALNASTLKSSSARTETPSPATTALQAEWGKPLRLNVKEKDNPLDISVYKLAARDGRGAWFARRSVHEGLSFNKWRDAIKSEFPTSLAVQGDPGEGNVRGIGADVRLEQKVVEGTGNLDVYHLSAQFPGPTAPRDFVELLITSPDDSPSASEKSLSPTLGPKKPHEPRSYIVLSKPCFHPNAEQRQGFTRGAYESIEMIREVPRRKRNSLSATDLKALAAEHRAQITLARDTLIRRAQAKSSGSTDSVSDTPRSPNESTDDVSSTDKPPSPRLGGKVISFSARRSSLSNRDRPELDADPVEWVQITRSDPGGSVPRFMVERGTPASIVADAAKFIDWACSNSLTATASSPAGAPYRPSLDAAGLPSRSSSSLPTELDLSSPTEALASSDPGPAVEREPEDHPKDGIFSMASSVAQIAKTRFEEYAPMLTSPFASTFQRAGETQQTTSTQESSVPDSVTGPTAPSLPSSASSVSSSGSFASAFNSPRAASPTPGSKEAQLASSHAARLAQLDAALEAAREKHSGDPKRLEKEVSRHAKAREKAEASHRKALAGADAARRKDERKQLERKAREARRERDRELKDERAGLRNEMKGLKDEVKALQETIRRLRDEKGRMDDVLRRVQGENTALVAKIGGLPGGTEVLEEVRASANAEKGKDKDKDKDKESTKSKDKDKEKDKESVKSAKSGKSGQSSTVGKGSDGKSVDTKE